MCALENPVGLESIRRWSSTFALLAIAVFFGSYVIGRATPTITPPSPNRIVDFKQLDQNVKDIEKTRVDVNEINSWRNELQRKNPDLTVPLTSNQLQNPKPNTPK